MSGEKRPDGYYWVRPREVDGWMSIQYRDGMFEYGGVMYRESRFHEIGPACNRDDAEQLRLAREVLQRVAYSPKSTKPTKKRIQLT